MNNTTNLALAAILAATLVVGIALAATTTTTTTAAFASSRGDGNENDNTDTVLQAQNKGFVSGFDTKLNQEADNTICTHPSGSCTVEGTQTPPPPPPPKDDDDDGEDRHDDSKKMDDKSNRVLTPTV
jgi:hypothetical protein